MLVIYISIKLIYNKYIDIHGKQDKLKQSVESFALRNRVSHSKFLWLRRERNETSDVICTGVRRDQPPVRGRQWFDYSDCGKTAYFAVQIEIGGN
jgi:hypothetical protein